MLTTLGKRTPEERSMRDLLLDCHARIRKFCALARRLSEGGPTEQVCDGAAQLRRYFAIALPLHIRDEDESLRPRLEQLGDGALSSALDAMSGEHLAVDAPLAALIEEWDAIVREPTEARCIATYEPALWLERHLLAHLRDEEALVFPALDRLPRAQWDAIAGEMQARRR